MTNPFTGLLPGSTINGATVRAAAPAAVPGVRDVRDRGVRRAPTATTPCTLQLEKRFRSGNSFTMQYTHSSLRDKLNYLNPADGMLEDRVSPNDRPNRFSIGASCGCRSDAARSGAREWNGATDAVLGGWQVSGTYQYQSGFPLTFDQQHLLDAALRRSELARRRTSARRSAAAIAGLDVPAWDTSCFYFHDAAVQTNGVDDPAKQRADHAHPARTTTCATSRRRCRTCGRDNLHLLDIGLYKNFSLPREMKLQVRFEAINALNYTVLWTPGVDPKATNGLFGFVNTDRNNPRDIQIGLRLTF